MLEANEDKGRLISTESGIYGLEVMGGGRIFTRAFAQVSRTDWRL